LLVNVKEDMKFLRPIFEKYHVAAYFSGYGHTLELEKQKTIIGDTYLIPACCHSLYQIDRQI
jgi:hypothetical protein